jgi:hypothetical protein
MSIEKILYSPCRKYVFVNDFNVLIKVPKTRRKSAFGLSVGLM